MSNATTRAALAAALSTVSGITGYALRPKVLRAGDAWPQWRGSERDDTIGFVETWNVLVVLPSDETTADSYADTNQAALLDALRPVMFVASFAPTLFTAEGNDVYALLITGRTE